MAKFDIVDGKLIKCRNGSADNGHIVIPKGCYEIGSEVFEFNTMVRSIAISEDVVVIHPSAFAHCCYLESVTLPSGLEVIGSNAFVGCRALREIKLPPWLKRIGNNAFQSCTALEKINIPASVRYVGRRAFLGCHDLTVTRCGSTDGWDEYWDHIDTDPGGIFKKERLYYVNVVDCSKEYSYYLHGKAYFGKNGDKSIGAAQVYSSLMRAAEAGIEEAYFLLGKCYAEGIGVAKDLKKAATWFEKALHTNTMSLLVMEHELAHCYHEMKGGADVTERAISLFRSVLARYDVAKDPYGILSTVYVSLADCYYSDCIKDYASALRYFELAANAGNVKGCTIVGAMYEKGRGAAPSLERALYWYEKAADKGSVDAQLWAANIYADRHTPAGDQRAVHLYQQAANAGNVHAAFRLAGLYAAGRGTEASYQLAEKWMIVAANGGIEAAQIKLVNWYTDSQTPIFSLEKSIPWLEKLALTGNEDVKSLLQKLRAILGRDQAREDYRLYQNYLYGFHDHPRDVKKAFEYLEKAVAADLPAAQYALGLCYYRGDWSYPLDRKRALELWEKAAKAGNRKAQTQLKQLADIRKKEENRARTQAQQARAEERKRAQQEPQKESQKQTLQDSRMQQLQDLLRERQSSTSHVEIKQTAINHLKKESVPPVATTLPTQNAPTPAPVKEQEPSSPTPVAKEQESPATVQKNPEPTPKAEPEKPVLTEAERREQRYLEALKMYYGADGVAPDLKRAFLEFQAIASEGHPAACVMEGVCRKYGHGTEKDHVAAFRCFERAAQKNEPDALYHLSYCYRSSEGVAKDEARANDLMTRAAALGSYQAYASLSNAYRSGYWGCPKDMAQSQMWFEKIRPHAEAGELQAQYLLGEGYRQYSLIDCGRDREQDKRMALQWLTTAAERGNRFALFNVAYAYSSGTCSAERNMEKAMRYYEKAAERGDVIATSRLADFHYRGEVCPQDYKKAAELYAVGVTSHDKVMLASCYLYGYGVEPDPARAIALSREAIEQKWCPVADKAVGYENLAYCYRYGKGVIRDLSKVKTYYKNAAVCGSVSALCTVADAYYNGVLSFPKDHAEAKKYYQKAADKGSEYAAEQLKKL